MKFSIVIPLYNKEKHVARAINSILNQTYQDFEIIIVDDGSTDFSYEEVKKINDPRIKIIRQKNLGVSSARNTGIKEAKNNYIGFLDADDKWKPDFLETIKKLIKDFPGAGAYATSYEIQKENRVLIKPISQNSFEKNWRGIVDDYFKHSLKTPLITASSVVIPKKVFEHLGGFPLNIKRGEDLDMWCRIALNYDIVFVNKVCVTYFQNAENRACEKQTSLKKSFANYADVILTNNKQAPKSSLHFEEYMIKIIISKARYLIRDNKRRDARKLLNKYKYTKYNKKLLIKAYILSLIPKSILPWAYKFYRILKKRE